MQAENDAKAQAESEKVQADQAAQAVSEPQQQVQPNDNYSGQSEVPNSPSQSTPTPPAQQAPSPGNQWGNTTPAEQGALEKGHSVMGGDESLNVYEK
ncbi:hypothetical protein [Lactococcus raffinolactis]|uniref:hypothetical protein n=1 Tax=Pseudolactococcus raffinolactis TaxID=1366 RepID=UPI0039B0917F